MLKTILVAYDGSEPAVRAFEFAMELAEPFGATVTVLAIAYPPGPPTAVETAGLLRPAKEPLEHALANLREATRTERVPLSTRVLVGRPAEQILHEAMEQGADLIVMGHCHGNWIERRLSEAVFRRVLNRASCPVAVVK